MMILTPAGTCADRHGGGRKSPAERAGLRPVQRMPAITLAGVLLLVTVGALDEETG